MIFFENLLEIGRSLKTLFSIPGWILWMTAIPTLDVASLPDDATLLKAHLADYVQKYQEARRYAQSLELALTKLRRMHFGPKSERLPEGQEIFPFYGTLEASKPAAARSGEEEKPRAKRKPDRTGARVLPEDLPVKMVLVDLPEDQKTCSCCGKQKILIGQEDSAQLDFEPGKFSKRVTRRNTYACPEACRGQVMTALLPVPRDAYAATALAGAPDCVARLRAAGQARGGGYRMAPSRIPRIGAQVSKGMFQHVHPKTGQPN
jgi:transposase